MRYIILSLLLLLASIPTHAYVIETGSIFGTVMDKETGNPIPYANVVVEGTILDALAGDDGSYVISGLPAGEYTVRAMMFGYATQRKYRITVAAGSSVEVHFTLEKQSG